MAEDQNRTHASPQNGSRSRTGPSNADSTSGPTTPPKRELGSRPQPRSEAAGSPASRSNASTPADSQARSSRPSFERPQGQSETLGQANSQAISAATQSIPGANQMQRGVEAVGHAGDKAGALAAGASSAGSAGRGAKAATGAGALGAAGASKAAPGGDLQGRVQQVARGETKANKDIAKAAAVSAAEGAAAGGLVGAGANAAKSVAMDTATNALAKARNDLKDGAEGHDSEREREDQANKLSLGQKAAIGGTGAATGVTAQVLLWLQNVLMMLQALFYAALAAVMAAVSGILGFLTGAFSFVMGVGAAISGFFGGVISAATGAAVFLGGAGMSLLLVASTFLSIATNMAQRDSGVLCPPAVDSALAAMNAAAAGGTPAANMEAQARDIYNFLSAKGMSDENIAGILGNFEQESGIDPTKIEAIYGEDYTIGPKEQAAINSGFKLSTWDATYASAHPGVQQAGIGLGQWTNERNQALMKYATDTGSQWYLPQTQLMFMMMRDDPDARKVINDMITNSYGGVVGAEEYFRKNWERIEDSSTSVRQTAAQKWFTMMPGWKAGSVSSAGSTAPTTSTNTSTGGGLAALGAYLGAGFNGTPTRSFGDTRVSVGQNQGKNSVRVLYPANSASQTAMKEAGTADGGAQGYYSLKSGAVDEATLSYSLFLPAGFNFVKGGKLPGLYGGTQTSGGNQGDGGFSTRFMWRKGGGGELYLYAAQPPSGPDVIQTGKGFSIGRDTFTFPTGAWSALQQHVKLNTPGKPDGVLQVSINGKVVINRSDIMYRTDPSLHIEGLFFSTFFGGDDATWASPTAQESYFADFKLAMGGASGSLVDQAGAGNLVAADSFGAATANANPQCVSNAQMPALGGNTMPIVDGWTNPTIDADGTVNEDTRFGMRMHPIYHEMRLHAGVDLGNEIGTPEWAAHAGTVTTAGNFGDAGNEVIIHVEPNIDLVYMHMSRIDVTVGQQVTPGQVLGLMGSTGASTASHLHFEVRINGVPTDPVPFMASKGIDLFAKPANGVGVNGASPFVVSGTEQTVLTRTTGYDWWDNTPIGSAAIAYEEVRNRHAAGGVGTYADPITIAMPLPGGHLQYPKGTRFYIPTIRRYAILEDEGDENMLLYADYGAQTWIDIWIDGSHASESAASACMDQMTDVQKVIVNPKPTYPVAPGNGVMSGTTCVAGFPKIP